MTKVRDLTAAIFAIILVIALVIGIMMALGKPVPVIGKFLGM
jgi:hypothetical protein